MADEVQKIVRTICPVSKNLLLKLHVRLVNERPDGRKDSFLSLFTTDGGNTTLNIDFQSFLTLEIKDGEWSPNKSIVITQRNIYQIVMGVRKCIDNIYDGGIFAVTKDGKPVIYDDKANDNTVRIFNMGNQRIILKPSLVYDDNEVSYEGAVMYINNLANFVYLTVTELETLYHSLSKVDIFTYSQLLLNCYISSIQQGKVEIKHTSIAKKKPPSLGQSVFDLPKTAPVQSTLSSGQSNEDYFGLKG